MLSKVPVRGAAQRHRDKRHEFSVDGAAPRHSGGTGGKEVPASGFGGRPAGAARARRARVRGGAEPQVRHHPHD